MFADGANTYMQPPEHTAESRQVLLGANNPDRSDPGPPWDLLEALARS